jgi:MOSC domain-containing protein YiiM
MKVLSVNVGLPREVTWQDKLVTTGIFKEPIQGRIMMCTLNLDGDQQADLTVHGGVNQAVYAYPSEHYDYWRTEFPGMAMPSGMFGENFTTEGLLENTVYIGDRVSNRRNRSHGHTIPNALLQTRYKVWPRRYHQTVSGQSSHRFLFFGGA